MKQLINWTVAILAFLLPLFFLPLTTDFYFFNKTILLYLSTALLLVLWAIKTAREKKLRIIHSALDFPILLYSISYILSVIFASPNKVEAIWGRAGMIISLTVIYFILSSNMANSKFYILYSLVASATSLSLLAIYQYIGVSAELFKVPIWMQAKTWTPAGSSLILLVFVAPVLILTLGFAFRSRDSLGKVILFAAAAMQLTGSLLVGSFIWPGKKLSLNFLPLRAGWEIAAGTFGNSPLFGTGPESFLSAFTRFRPAYLNNLNLWTSRFLSSSNEYLQIFTTIGVLGLSAYLFLIWRFAKFQFFSGKRRNKTLGIVLAFIIILQLFMPANLLLLFLEFALLGILAAENGQEKLISLPKNFAYIPFLLTAVCFLLTAYFSGRVWLANYYLRQSIFAAKENKGNQTYQLQIKALKFNPYIDRYHIAFSQTNLALANSITEKKDLSDQDKQNINQLIQQSVREAKIATSLNPDKVTNWENLAALYRNLINFAQGSDQWSIAAYIKAIRLDPSNPVLRVSLGGLYYSLKNYDDAIRQFQIATELKPDYANAYYNLAYTYREKGELKKAIDNMQIVANLVDVNSKDYQKIKNELDELKKNSTQKAKEVKGETLKEPQPLPSPKITPAIKLPAKEGFQINPTPEASATPTLTPAP